VIVPALYVLPETTAANLEAFAAAGGIVLFTPRTGVKDDTNTVVDMKLPGLVARMSGVEVQEYVSMPLDADNRVQFGLPNLEEEFTASVWADVLEPRGAEVVARYADDYFAGEAAVTLNRFGDGRVIYLGTLGDADYYAGVARWVLELAGITSLLGVPEGVEVAERWQGNRQLLFVLNHSGKAQTITLDKSYTDLVSGARKTGAMELHPYDVLTLVG
jgi:beta-galactosidase